MTLRLSEINGEYWLWPSSDDISELRDQLHEALSAAGPGEEQVTLQFVGDGGLDALFAGQNPGPVSIGWEGLILPFADRRTVRLPHGITVTADATSVGLETLLRLRPYAPWILQILDSPHLSLDESLLIHRDDELIGWIPIWRPSARTSILRLVVLHPDVHRGEERRRTHLQLAAFSRAIESQCSQDRSVICWMPDDGDAVNALKLSIADAARVTHWMSIQVRRDLQPLVAAPKDHAQHSRQSA
jgi:hypothetical protein